MSTFELARPFDYLTRAEMAKMIVMFTKITPPSLRDTSPDREDKQRNLSFSPPARGVAEGGGAMQCRSFTDLEDSAGDLS
jgi:hypothetical protein